MNTVTTKDVNVLAAATPMAYDYFGAGWAVSNMPSDGPLEPVARFGIGDMGQFPRETRPHWGALGAVRTSRREQGFGNMVGLGFLDEPTPVIGIPLWATAAAGIVLLTGAFGIKKSLGL